MSDRSPVRVLLNLSGKLANFHIASHAAVES